MAAATDERTAYELANDLTTIFRACALAGMDVPDFDYGTMKLYCPFDDEKAFRIYAASNSAYCFACSKKYTPVSLYAEFRGITIDEAAQSLIELAEAERRYTPPTPDARWDALMSTPFDFDRPSEAEALKMYCARIDKDWDTHQFLEDVGAVLTKCLAPLDRVNSTEELHQWRATTRRLMTTVLGATRERESHG